MLHASWILVLALGACVLPPRVTVESNSNTAPVIDLNTSKPAKAAITMNLNCASCDFTIVADDPDADPLYAHWFVDYDKLGGSQSYVNECDSAQIPSGTAFVCAFPVGSRFKPIDSGTSHTVEVWISDRAFLQTGPQVNRSIDSGAGLVTRTWTLNLKFGGSCDDPEGMHCVGAATP